MQKIYLILVIALVAFTKLHAQNIDLDKYEIYIGDTLISKADFIKNGQDMEPGKAQRLQFRPRSNGVKNVYYLNGQIYATGKMENLSEQGVWEYWHANGNKAREGTFIEGKQNGIHKYWYENGNLRAIGNWKNGVYDGQWEMYAEDRAEKVIQTYKDGELVGEPITENK